MATERIIKNGKKPFRFEYCERCKNCKTVGSIFCISKKKNVNRASAMFCKYFKYKYPSVNTDRVDKNGVLYRSQQGRELLTQKEWESHGYRIKKDAIGVVMHPRIGCNKLETYYTLSEVEH